jgi:hypothetical protein
VPQREPNASAWPRHSGIPPVPLDAHVLTQQDRPTPGTGLTWLFFFVFAAGVAGIGSIVLFLAFFVGHHETVGVELYAGGAIGTAGAFALIGQLAALRPMRLTSTTIAVVVGLLWLLLLPSFVSSPGWNF